MILKINLKKRMKKMKNPKMNSLFFVILTLFLAIFLISCSSVSMEQAESSAKQFITTNVIFHVQNKTIVPYVYIADRKKEGGNFVFTGMASTTNDKEVKSAKFSVVVDNAGKVIMFNGKEVSALPNQNNIQNQ